MQELQLKAAVRYQIVKSAIADKADELVRDERGELGSWLILAAGLAIAAGAAVAALSPWFTGKVGDITSN